MENTTTIHEPAVAGAETSTRVPSSVPTTEPAVVAVFATHAAAEDAIRSLQRAGFDLRHLSIVGREYHTEERPVGFYNTGDRMKVWGKWGAFWGALLGILVSPAFFFLPLLGHVVVFGPLSAALIGALEGGVVGGGVSALAAALAGIGVPRDSVLRYEAAIKADKFLLIVHGTQRDAAEAQRILRGADAESVEEYGSSI